VATKTEVTAASSAKPAADSSSQSAAHRHFVLASRDALTAARSAGGAPGVLKNSLLKTDHGCLFSSLIDPVAPPPLGDLAGEYVRV